MSNQFFADLELAMQPRRDAEARVVEAARKLLSLIDTYGTNAPLHYILKHDQLDERKLDDYYQRLRSAIADLDFVEKPTQFCTFPKHHDRYEHSIWLESSNRLDITGRRAAWLLEHQGCCGGTAYYNNHTRCTEHKQ